MRGIINNMTLRYAYNDVKNIIESKNCKLLSENYINRSTRLKIECSKGHIFEMTLDHFNKGHKCSACNKRLTIEYVREFIEAVDSYKVLSDKYTNARDPLKIMCPNKHTYKASFSSFKSGRRCPKCFVDSRKNAYSDVKNYIESFDGYKLLSAEYKNAHSKLRIKCTKNHIFSTTYSNFLSLKRRCPSCSANISKQEKEVVEIVKNHYNGNIIENDKTQIINYWTKRKLELDIWLPEINKAIEFNCDYSHRTSRSKWTDEIKVKRCIQKKIKLLIVRYENWIQDKQQEIRKIICFLGDNHALV